VHFYWTARSRCLFFPDYKDSADVSMNTFIPRNMLAFLCGVSFVCLSICRIWAVVTNGRAEGKHHLPQVHRQVRTRGRRGANLSTGLCVLRQMSPSVSIRRDGVVKAVLVPSAGTAGSWPLCLVSNTHIKAHLN